MEASVDESKRSGCLCAGCIFSFILTCVVVIYYVTMDTRRDDVFLHAVRLSTPEAVKLILTSNNCTNVTKIVLIVTSYAGDVETRSAVRQAYPERLLNEIGIKRVFLLARIHPDRNMNGISQAAIENEKDRFNDIIQGDFIEDYHNLTLKHLMGLNWASLYCRHVAYIIKMDHDIVVDLFSISHMLDKLPRRNYILAGYVMSNMKPIRERNSKWYVPHNEYTKNYPSFLSGWLYITNPATAQQLYTASFNEPHFWIDDLYITGILAQEIAVPLVRLNRYYTTDPELIKCCFDHDKIQCRYWIGPNGGQTKLVQKFAAYAQNCQKKSCKKSKSICLPTN